MIFIEYLLFEPAQYFFGLHVPFKDTILNEYKTWRFKDLHIWQVLILAILGQLRV